ncbi:aldo-keto reductase-like protein [Halenospora varia]|nr:aldo-keto reductase-like protein [Halenospora varia]
MATDSTPKMEYTRLGNSGLKISKVIFGAMSFGSPDWQEWVIDEAAALPLLKHAYDVGLNTWDTADVYSNGRSEEIIGKALKTYNIPRSKVVILSKCFFGVAQDGSQPPISAATTNDGEMVNQVGLSRKHILDAVDRSCERLGTYIDVLQIHRLDRETPREEIMRALNDVVESGKVRYIGASSMAAWEFHTLQNIAEKHGWHKFVSMQNYYNLLYREEEREMIPYCRDVGVGLIPWSPIARGALSRPFNDRSTKREKSDRMLNAMIRGKETEIDKTIITRVEEIAKKHGVSMATIATAWCLSKNSVNPIIGLSSKERIDQAVASVHFASSGKLSKEDIEYLEEGYAPKERQGY